MNTPVLALLSWRSSSDLAAIDRRYSATASAGVAAPNVHRGSTASGQSVGDQAVDQVVFGCQHHVGGAEQGVGPGGEHLDVAVAGAKQRSGAGGAADPVALHGLDLLRPVQHVEILEQPVRVRGDAHHPLPQPFPEHREVAAVTAAVGGDLLVGQHRAQPGTPVHHRIGAVHQPVGVDHVGALAGRQRRPLPAVVRDCARRNRTRPPARTIGRALFAAGSNHAL